MKQEDLRIAVFSSYDKLGGAATACYHLVKLFRENGYSAVEVVRNKTGNDDFVFPVYHTRCHRIKNKIYRRFFPSKLQDGIIGSTDPEYRYFGDDSMSADMCTAEEIVRSLPFVPNVILVGHSFGLANTTILNELYKRWKSHIFLICSDVNAYTGGCHVHWDCKGYTSGCKDCPAIIDKTKCIKLEQAFIRKLSNIREARIGVLYSNNWQKLELEKSLLFKSQLKYCFGQLTDTDLYNPNNRDIAKKVFEIPSNSFTIMNGATYLDDNRKGFRYFCEAMKILWDDLLEETRESITIILIGRNKSAVQQYIELLPPFTIKFIDFITDERLLSLVYQASDLYVGTSLEDAGPMMVSDSLACGTPVVGFKTGFIADPEIICAGLTGYAVDIKDTKNLAKRIKDILFLSNEKKRVLSENCRQIAIDKLSRLITIAKFNELFKKL